MTILASAAMAANALAVEPENRPARAILLIVDGLHWQAPERLGLKNFLAVAKSGARAEKMETIVAYHPKSSEYAAMHNGSIPNPVMLAGTVFIRPKQQLVQDVFGPADPTAHVTNCRAYTSLNPGNTYSMVRDTTDDAAIAEALALFQRNDIRFMRIHLQETGSAGWKCHLEEKAVPWRQNIWGEGSPYVAAARHADQLLGDLISGLKAMGKWDGTLLVVTSDHGNARTGAHPITEEESRLCPLAIAGPGIRPGAVIPSVESIDLIPTICFLMGKQPPNPDGGSGRILAEAFVSPPPDPGSPRHLGDLNRQIVDYEFLVARLRTAAAKNPAIQTEIERAEDAFLGIERFTDWPGKPDVAAILANNKKVLETLHALDKPQ
ncbi:MAG: alkaline phosphatase family protein [Verrucomicrobiae bacterium]